MISITLAYVITADAIKIVQVIEGKDKKRDQVVMRSHEVTQKYMCPPIVQW